MHCQMRTLGFLYHAKARHDMVSFGIYQFSRNGITIYRYTSRDGHKLAAKCDLIFGILTCNLPQDTIDVDLKVHTLLGIHTYKKDRNTQVIKCSPWGTEVKPFPSLQRKMMEFLMQRQIITYPFANRSYQSRPKAIPIRRHNLVTLTRANREKLFQPRKVNVGPYPPAMQRNWLTTVKAKKLKPHQQVRHPYLPSQQKYQLPNPLLYPIQSTVQSAPF